MAIENGTYIKLSYTGSVNGSAFDTTDIDVAKTAKIFRENAIYGPSIVKVGAGHLLPGLDDDLAGKEVGTEYTIVLPAEKAFGEHKTEDVKAVDKKAFEKKPELFERVSIEGRDGVVVNKIGSRFLVDFNHPLAGQEVTYVYTIESIVEDGTEKLTGIIKLITGRDMIVDASDKTCVSIEIPAMMAMYNKNWFMTQYMISQEAFADFPEIENVKFVESFPRPKAKTEEAPAEVEAAE
ncbi:MAG TPA: FKBP-type peptidyl-prolyl cis-trans isomerase [Methanocorpusculum sp.]|nr:FKBP-type peptidyl-prolyl cis-trans isomerase [Methanocorpusculum sp.]